MASAGSRTRRRRALTDWPRSWLLPPILHPSAWHNHLAQPVADDAPATVAVGQLDALVVVLDLVRTGAACTRPGRARRSDFDRTVVTQRVQQLLDSGLLEEGALAPSTGGRAPRELRFCARWHRSASGRAACTRPVRPSGAAAATGVPRSSG